MKRLLIANRGEIACRIITTAQRMGLSCIAIYAEADRQAKFVELADEAYPLLGQNLAETYLNQTALLELCLAKKIDAVHPGYGFLSENAAFARLLEKNSIKFVGPSADAIEAMGDKATAKKRLASAGIPLTPGYHGEDQREATLQKAAKDIGFPLLIKASAGGGGKGMRPVLHADEFSQALSAAQREAKNAFGDDTVLLEKLVQHPRHIEVQIFFDSHGKGVFLFDRDCSIQRRHQKVVEEAPAPGLSPELRKRMGEAALACGRAINYEGAGTVEFLLEGSDTFYFMEMNTRLQVEHPVSEMITGQDFVEWQLNIANGQHLPLAQQQLKCQGHAIEVRLYAEDPDNQFLPSLGSITTLNFPDEATQFFPSGEFHHLNHIKRFDSGIRLGDEVGPQFDPMLAKIIVWGASREQSIKRLSEALQQTDIGGLTTNLAFLNRLLWVDDFQTANLSTDFIETHKEHLREPEYAPKHVQAAVALILHHTQLQETPPNPLQDPYSPWHSLDGWKLNLPSELIRSVWFHNNLIWLRWYPAPTAPDAHPGFYRGHYADADQNSEAQPTQPGTHILDEPNSDDRVPGNNTSGELSAHIEQSACNIWWKGTRHEFRFRYYPDYLTLYTQKERYTFRLTPPPGSFEEDSGRSKDKLTAPMGGLLTRLMTKEGTHVEKDDVLAVMEAMKMEHSIKSPRAGIVDTVHEGVGNTVSAGATLISLKTEEH